MGRSRSPWWLDPRTRLSAVGVHNGIGASQRQLSGAHPVGILRKGLSPTCVSSGAGVEVKPHLRNVLQVLLQGLGHRKSFGICPSYPPGAGTAQAGNVQPDNTAATPSDHSQEIPKPWREATTHSRGASTISTFPCVHALATLETPTEDVPARGDGSAPGGSSPGGHGARAALGAFGGDIPYLHTFIRDLGENPS